MILHFKGRVMAFLKPWTHSMSVAALMALTACGGSTGPVAQEVVVPTETETEIEVVDPTTDRTDDEEIDPVDPLDDDLGSSPPPVVDDTAPSLEDFGSVPPEEVEASDPVLLATLAAFSADTTAISAAVLVTDPTSGERSILSRDGLYARIDGTLSLADGAAALNNDVLGDYDNAASFSQSDAVGIVGLATPTADIRSTGDATYNGGASGFVIAGTTGVDLIKGQSLVEVAFGVDRVTVTLDDFEGVSQVSGFVVDSPITEMVLRNAVIADGGFTGGTLNLRNADGSIDITGTDTTTLSQGKFFGLEADGETPNEVGGVILSEGDSGIVFGTFIAD